MGLVIGYIDLCLHHLLLLRLLSIKVKKRKRDVYINPQHG